VKPGTTKDEFRKAIEEGNLEGCLNSINVDKGDVFFIPAGTLHAICKGLLIAEIQQNSDTTYRVYDWNRVDSNGISRPLHLEKALEIINFNDIIGREKVNGVTVTEGDNLRTHLVACKYFVTDKIKVNGLSREFTNGDRFDIILVIEGEGKIIYSGGEEDFTSGDSFVIPACLNEYAIQGMCTIIKSYVPHTSA
jgi:mannose-6-phosphate isomerase